mgnify:FL=1
MRYAIYDPDKVIVNTIECDDPAFAASLGAVEYPYPEPAETTPEPSENDIILDLLADHEYRLCMAELNGGETTI